MKHYKYFLDLEGGQITKRWILPGVTTLKKKSLKCAWHLALHSNAISDPFEVCLSLVEYILQEETHWIYSMCISDIQRALVKGSALIFSLFTWINAIMSQSNWILTVTWLTVYTFSSDCISPSLYLEVSPWENHVKKLIRNLMDTIYFPKGQLHAYQWWSYGHHLFPKGTTPCTPVLVINFKNQSHIPDTTVPFQSVCSPVLKVCSLRVTYIHPVHANLSGSVPSCQVSVHKLLTVELEVGKGPILNVFWTLQSAHSSLCFVAHQEKQPRENGEGAVAAF